MPTDRPHLSCPDVPAGARPFPPKAATPHAPLSLPTGEARMAPPGTVVPRAPDDERLRAGAVARTVPHSPYQGRSA